MSTQSFNLEVQETLPKAIDALEGFFDGMERGLAATVEMATDTGVANYQKSAVALQEAGLAVLKSGQDLRDMCVEVKKVYDQLADL